MTVDEKPEPQAYLGPNMFPNCSLVAWKDSVAIFVLTGCLKPPSLILHARS